LIIVFSSSSNIPVAFKVSGSVDTAAAGHSLAMLDVDDFDGLKAAPLILNAVQILSPFLLAAATS
jgi:hypothetical protein